MVPTSKICTTSCGDDPFEIRETLLPSMPAPDLSHPIHPLFSQEKFASFPKTAAYPELACRLASAFLERAMPFVHALLVAGESPKGNTSTYIESFPAPLPSLTNAQKEETVFYLNKAAEKIDFKAEALEETNGLCHSHKKVRYTHLPGCGSTIVIDTDEFAQVHRAKISNDTCAYLWYSLTLAQLFIHELSHALVNAALPHHHNAYNGTAYIAGSQTCEIGHLCEVYLFGGILNTMPVRGEEEDCPFYHNADGKASSLSGLILVTDYPNQDYLQGYEELPFRGPPLAEVYGHWNVSFQWIHGLFQQEFWDKALDGRTDITFLHPKKKSGCAKMVKRGKMTVEKLHTFARTLKRQHGGEFVVRYDGTITPVDPPVSRSRSVKSALNKWIKKT